MRREPQYLGVRRRAGRPAKLRQHAPRICLIVKRPYVWDSIREMANRYSVTLSSFVEDILEDHVKWRTREEQKTGGGFGRKVEASRLAYGIYTAAQRKDAPEVEGGFNRKSKK